MQDLFVGIKNISDYIATNHQLDLSIFFIIYLTSFVPFYFGYFLIFYGSTRRMRFSDIIGLRIHKRLQWTEQSRWGLLIHLFGRLMPYAYIVLYGRNLSLWIYIVVLIIVVASILISIKKLFGGKNAPIENVVIIRKNKVTDEKEIEKITEIYNKNFEKVNKISPCKQSFDALHFHEVLQEDSVDKYLIYGKNGEIFGIGLITADFKNTPWISEDYFKFNFPNEHSKRLIYYFLGLAVDENLQNKKYSIPLIEHIIDDLPLDAIMGFDHSRNINPLLHHFTRIVRQARTIERTHIDRQHYHVIQRKK